MVVLGGTCAMLACSTAARSPSVLAADVACLGDGGCADAAAADLDVADLADTPTAVDTLAPPDVAAGAADVAPDTDAAADGGDASVDATADVGGLPPGACPVADLVVKEGWAVVPQTLLHLKSGGSDSAVGTSVVKVKWWVTQPVGSYAALQPNDTFANPTFQANVSGKYTICLDVWDSNGLEACKKTCVDVSVMPEKAIHIELLWDTPNDPDQTNSGPAAGADFDLHFAHEMASGPDLDCDGKGDPWFSNPFDCFWFNANPNWAGSDPTIDDDPSLDLDDTDGAGPEIMNLATPEGTQDSPTTYAVGAQYWNDHGFGPSFASVRIYVLGVQVVDFAKVAMDPLDMWYVGKINWPNQMSGGTFPVFSPCFQSGNACGAGKMWQPSGDWCITKCYSNKGFSSFAGGATPAACPKP